MPTARHPPEATIRQTMSHCLYRRPDDSIVRGVTRLTRRRAGALVLFCTLSTLWIATAATARPPSAPAALSPADFHPIDFGPGNGAPDSIQHPPGCDRRADRRLRRRAADARAARATAAAQQVSVDLQGAPDAQGQLDRPSAPRDRRPGTARRASACAPAPMRAATTRPPGQSSVSGRGEGGSSTSAAAVRASTSGSSTGAPVAGRTSSTSSATPSSGSRRSMPAQCG